MKVGTPTPAKPTWQWLGTRLLAASLLSVIDGSCVSNHMPFFCKHLWIWIFWEFWVKYRNDKTKINIKWHKGMLIAIFLPKYLWLCFTGTAVPELMESVMAHPSQAELLALCWLHSKVPALTYTWERTRFVYWVLDAAAGLQVRKMQWWPSVFVSNFVAKFPSIAVIEAYSVDKQIIFECFNTSQSLLCLCRSPPRCHALHGRCYGLCVPQAFLLTWRPLPFSGAPANLVKTVFTSIDMSVLGRHAGSSLPQLLAWLLRSK